MLFAMPVAGQRRRVRSVLDRMGTDRSGAVSVIFALVILPLLIAVGAAVDYAIAARTKEMLQAAADAAAVGAISMSSSAVKQVIQSGVSGEIKVAETDALNIAQTNFSGSRFSNITSSQISVNMSEIHSVPTWF